jgi:heat shock protein HtpX
MFKIIVLLILLTAFFLFICRLFTGIKGMGIALILALSINLFMTWNSDTMMLNAYKTHSAPENHRFVSITKEVSEKSGLPMPGLYIIPSRTAVIICPEKKSVTATEGLFTMLNDNELRSVIAHELAHIVNHDNIIQTITATLSGAITLLSLFALFFGARASSNLGWVKTITLALVAPAIASVITMGISRQKEYRADEYSARLTGEPVALATALQKIAPEAKGNPVVSNKPKSPHHLMGNLMAAIGSWEIFSTHPVVEKRVARLKELAAELKEQQ